MSSLVISCLPCVFEAGLRPASFFNNTCARVCVLAWGLDLLRHISLVTSCLSCLFEAGLRPASFFNNTCARVCVPVWDLDLLSISPWLSHASLVFLKLVLGQLSFLTTHVLVSAYLSGA